MDPFGPLRLWNPLRLFGLWDRLDPFDLSYPWNLLRPMGLFGQ
jgi:hypothetical protein